MTHHIAIDIGASSGRLMLATYHKNSPLQLTELHRFSNGSVQRFGQYLWEIDALIHEIFLGLEKAKVQGITHATLAIDTWAVDYVLVSSQGHKIKDPVAYRDDRTQGMMDKLSQTLPKAEHYHKTGIQFLDFNTIYQLATERPDILAQAHHILLIPDYIGYVLTGKAVTEYTNATTTALLNHQHKTWDEALLKYIGVRADQFPPLTEAGTYLGELLPHWHDTYQLPQCQVYLAPTHDTAAAVLAVPTTEPNENWAFISSGTWSLLGAETKGAIVTDKALMANYSNEGGAYNTNRFLKNIMGLWLIQGVQKSWYEKTGRLVDFSTLVKMASAETPQAYLIDANDPSFLNPLSMLCAIEAYCHSHNRPVPVSLGQFARCVFDSLALSYKTALEELEDILGKPIDTLYLIGGGSQNHLLNQLTADLTGKKVVAGPVEATAIGNILSQLIATGALSDLTAGRELVRQSFELTTFIPAPH